MIRQNQYVEDRCKKCQTVKHRLFIVKDKKSPQKGWTWVQCPGCGSSFLVKRSPKKEKADEKQG